VIELPVQEPCEFCEGMAGRAPTWVVIDECPQTLTVINPYQFEVGQSCVITRRHVGTLLDLTDNEASAVVKAAKRVAKALVDTYKPLGVLTFQNNGVYSGQEVPHYHFHVVPRQEGSDWGIGPPQLAVFEGAGRASGTPHDATNDEERRRRVQVAPSALRETVEEIRVNLPDQ
jgi:histidine triad (HIT) family protein